MPFPGARSVVAWFATEREAERALAALAGSRRTQWLPRGAEPELFTVDDLDNGSTWVVFRSPDRSRGRDAWRVLEGHRPLGIEDRTIVVQAVLLPLLDSSAGVASATVAAVSEGA